LIVVLLHAHAAIMLQHAWLSRSRVRVVPVVTNWFR
jgi:hypothetical protein